MAYLPLLMLMPSGSNKGKQMSLSRYCLAFLTATALTGAAHAASLPPGWTSQGNAGSAEPNGDVVGPPAQGPN